MSCACYECGVQLDKTNWMPSFKKRDQRICKTCYRERFNSKNNKINNPLALYINGKYISRKDPLYKMFKPGYYKSINDGLFKSSGGDDITYGEVYIITNKAWDGWVKIGMAVDSKDRLKGYQTSSPHRDYKLVHKVFSNDRRSAEAQAHTEALKIAEDHKNEWFKISIADAINILDNLNERHGATKEANTDTAKDKLQERPVQADFGF